MPVVEQGFILTSQSVDVDGHARVILWLNTEQGPSCLLIDDLRPNFFVLAADEKRLHRVLATASLNAQYEYKSLPLKNFQHEAVGSCYFKTNQAFYEARRLLKQSHITVYEADIRLHERYLMERFIKGSVVFAGKNITACNANYQTFSEVQTKAGEYQPRLTLLSFDLECSKHGELYSCGFYGQSAKLRNSKGVPGLYRKVIMIGEAEQGEKWIEWVADERNLILKILDCINQFDPDVLIGWNVVDFDCRLLLQRAAVHKLKLTLGRDGSEPRWRDNKNDIKQGFISLAGRVVIDGIDALKAASYSFPSFSLEAVSQALLKRGKKTEKLDQRTDEIDYNFIHNKQRLAEYNLEDCRLVWDIFQKTGILNYLVFRSQLTGLALNKVGGSVAAFSNLYLPGLHRAGYIAPNLPADGGLASPGGYVMESKPGLYDNVLVLDFKSLYPSIIRTFKVDPLGLLEGLQHSNEAIKGYLGAYFSRDKHLLPDILTRLWQQRDVAKADGDLHRSQAIKIIMSSFYGVLGSGGCRFYDPRLASSITLRGHEIMQTTAALIHQQGYSVIYGDTDSTFVLLGSDYSGEEVCAIGKQLADTINRYWQQYLQTEFKLDSYLEIEFETYYSRFLMPKIRGSETGSKKRYAGLVEPLSSHGIQVEPKLVFKGLESVRTDWTELAKEFQTQLYWLVFKGQDPSCFLRDFVSQTLLGQRDHQLVYRKRLRRPLASYEKNIPPHVRAAKLADEQNQRLGRPLRYQHKGQIAYIMTLQGPQALEYQTHPPDYTLYIERQLKAVADAILPFVDLSFDDIISQQMGLF